MLKVDGSGEPAVDLSGFVFLELLTDSLALVQTLNITRLEIKARIKALAAHSSTAHLFEPRLILWRYKIANRIWQL